MRAFAWLRSRPRAVASAAVLSAVAVAITTMAFVYDGFPTTEVDLHDGGVWVTKQSSLLIGHFNHESQVLDGGLRTASDEYDILQSGDDVVMVDSAGSVGHGDRPRRWSRSPTPRTCRPARRSCSAERLSRSSIPRRAPCGSCPRRGSRASTSQATEPTAEIGADGDVTVGVDGTVYAVSTETSEVDHDSRRRRG